MALGRRIVVALAALVAACILVEVGFRLLEKPLGVKPWHIRDMRALLVEGRMLHFEARAHTVFQRPRSAHGYNSYGFNDRPWRQARIPGVPRILCLGGSTTEGGNTGSHAGSYPRQLEKILRSETGRRFQVMNAGISGWNSAEILVSWFLTLQDFEPDLVLIHEGVNDLAPRFQANFQNDYSHWRRPMQPPATNLLTRFLARWSDLYLHLRLMRDGIPDIGTVTVAPFDPPPYLETGAVPPAFAYPFRRNIESIAQGASARGARVALMTMPWSRAHDDEMELWSRGIGANNTILRELAAERGYLLIDAAARFEAQGDVLGKEFDDLVHLSPAGNMAKARAAAEVLLEQWVPGLPPAPGPGAAPHTAEASGAEEPPH